MSNHSLTPTIGFPFVGDTVGGSHLSALLLMQELPHFGFRAIALVHGDGPLTDYLDFKGVNFFKTNLPYFDAKRSGITALARSLVIAPRIAAFLRRSNISLIHVNDGRMIASWTLASRLSACPIVLHARHRWSQSRLAHMCFRLAKERLAYQEYSTIHEDLDSQVQQAYLKRTRTMGKTKKGGPGGKARPGAAGPGTALSINRARDIGDSARMLMDRRKRWESCIGPVFKDMKHGIPDKDSTIFDPKLMEMYEKVEMEAIEEAEE